MQKITIKEIIVESMSTTVAVGLLRYVDIHTDLTLADARSVHLTSSPGPQLEWTK